MNRTWLALLASTFLFAGCSSAPKEPAAPTERLVFGRILEGKDLPPAEMKVTYAVSDFGGTGLFSGFEEKSPELDQKTGFYWVSVPIDSRFFGIRSIQFVSSGRKEPILMRADDKAKSLAGVELPKGNDPVYVGDISFKSVVKPLPPKADADAMPVAEVKDFVVRKNEAEARKFLNGRNIDPESIYVRIFSKRDLSPFVQ